MQEVAFIPFDEQDFLPTPQGRTLSQRANDKLRNA
jgi:hypothetical protein